MNRFLYGLTIVACTAALSTGCCKKGSDEAESDPGAATAEPAAASGDTITGEQALTKLKAGGFTPLTDPVVADNAGIKSTAVVLKPDMITVNIIEYKDASMAKMAASASPSSATLLSHLAGNSVIRVVCAGKPKEKCEKVMSVIKE
jgi:hypothetical protein